MECIHSLKDLPSFEKTSVALGYFDGFHLGHQAVIKAAVKSPEKTTIVFSFTTGDDGKTDKGKNAPRLITLEEKIRLCDAMGVDYLVVPPFSDIRDIPAEDFVKKTLGEQLNAGSISCGFNFRFGKNAEGDGPLLEKLCQENKIALTQLQPIAYEGAPISTSRIREDLLEGKVHDVNAMLGRVISYCSEVVHGEKLGRKLGFPTANEFFAPHQTVPKYGIYAAIVEIGEKRYRGVTSIGVKPTIEGERPPNMETYIRDFSGDIYGEKVRVGLYALLRDEQKFESIDELKAQIGRDSENAEEMLTDEILLNAVL